MSECSIESASGEFLQSMNHNHRPGTICAEIRAKRDPPLRTRFLLPVLMTSLALIFPVRAEAGPDSSLPGKAKAILEQQCFSCHGATQMGGLDLRQRENLLKGGTRGPALVPGDPESSVLYQAVARTGDLMMPLGQEPLAAEDLETLRRWIEEGALWEEGPQIASEIGWWAFRRPASPSVPNVKDSKWVGNPIDAFILRRLEEKGLKPAPPGGRLTLLRRAKFDLHGLPPTEEEIREFLSDTGPGAFERLVERLLASPRYGEAWGRHWLDVARYADSSGMDEDLTLPYAWRYRDYVIESFNLDIPYDRFVREQIAGDLLPGENPGQPNVRGILGTGFLALGPRSVARQDKTLMIYEVVEEQIDTVSQAFMGLSIACARCHDHKFDPITTEDYYSMAAVFASTRSFREIIPQGVKPPYVSRFYFEPLVPKEEYERYKEHKDRIQTKETQIDAVIETDLGRRARTQLYPRLIDYLLAARQVYQENQELAEVSEEENLDQTLLEKWVEHLDPEREFRPYHQQWHEASDSELQAVAEEYQKMFLTTAREWHEKIEKWKKRLDAAIEEGKKTPKKPLSSDDFVTVEERFFFEVDQNVFGIPGISEEDKEKREKLLSDEAKKRVAVLRKELEKLKEASPPDVPLASAVAEGESVEQRVFIRGDHRRPGEVVPKQFPVVLAGHSQTPITQGSGRKQLAEWLTQPSHPLTSRVMVNRIWQWHFGEGLVRTANNFGTAGEKPTHPELLDYLASEFVRRGWSMKSMHRLIMSSNTYQMSSRVSEGAKRSDVDNRSWSRFPRRGLSVEEVRDSFLALDSSLDLTMGGTFGPSEMSYNAQGPEQAFHPDKTRRRTVYVLVIRNKLPSMMRLFDFVDSLTSCPKRTDSNTSLQALYMLNSENLRERSRSFARYLLDDKNYDDRGRVKRAYRITLTREPTPEELDQALQYVGNYPHQGQNSDSDRQVDARQSQVDAWQSFCRVLMTSNEFNFAN